MNNQTNNNYYIFSIDDMEDLNLYNPEGAFKPTETTKTLVNEIRNYINKPCKILDLGCGIGVSGLALNKLGLVNEPLYGSDIGQEAISAFEINSKTHNCNVIAKCGSVFEPWENEKFDVIVDDISGVAEPIAEISPWFDGVSCKSGHDGTDLIVSVLNSASKYLNEDGVLFYPVISFSNVEKINKVANENFKHVKKLNRTEWPLPKEMYQHKSVLENLKSEKNTDYTEKFGMVICYTDIYIAYN